MLIIKLLAGFAFVGSVLWFVAQPNYETAIAVVTSLSALIGSIVVERHRKSHAAQRQAVGERGVGVQAGGDVNIGTIQSGDTKNAR